MLVAPWRNGCRHHSPDITVLAVQIASSCFLVLVSLAAAAGFITYGGRLFLMLHRFPIESPGRLKKLREVRPAASASRVPHTPFPPTFPRTTSLTTAFVCTLACFQCSALSQVDAAAAI